MTPWVKFLALLSVYVGVYSSEQHDHMLEMLDLSSSRIRTLDDIGQLAQRTAVAVDASYSEPLRRECEAGKFIEAPTSSSGTDFPPIGSGIEGGKVRPHPSDKEGEVFEPVICIDPFHCPDHQASCQPRNTKEVPALEEVNTMAHEQHWSYQRKHISSVTQMRWETFMQVS